MFIPAKPARPDAGQSGRSTSLPVGYYPVFSFRENPAIDKPLIRKSRTFVESLVTDKLAHWIDPQQPRLGIQMRSYLRDDRFDASLNRAAGSGFDTAWSIRQSGYAGPLCWQLKSASL